MMELKALTQSGHRERELERFAVIARLEDTTATHGSKWTFGKPC
jgi:hypothetical protein